jgi:hypothetical protein
MTSPNVLTKTKMVPIPTTIIEIIAAGTKLFDLVTFTTLVFLFFKHPKTGAKRKAKAKREDQPAIISIKDKNLDIRVGSSVN